MALLRRHRLARARSSPGLVPRSSYVAGKPVSSRVSPFRPTAEDLAILRAVFYAAVFDYPLSAEELWRSLPRHRTSVEAVRRAIAERPFLRDRIELVDGWYVPAGRRNLVQRRRERETASRAFLSRHRSTLDIVCAVPFTRLVAISGSLAHLNSDDDADLDLFIVTSGPRVWTVALTLVVLSRLLGRRKVVCANFLLADSDLALDQHDLYTASQVLHLRPVMGSAAMSRFLAANPFVYDWFPNAANADPVDFPLPAAGRIRRLKPLLEMVLWVPSGVIEIVSRSIYRWHLRRRVSQWDSPDQVRLESRCLKLHTHSHRTEVLNRFETMVARATGGRRPGGVC